MSSRSCDRYKCDSIRNHGLPVEQLQSVLSIMGSSRKHATYQPTLSPFRKAIRGQIASIDVPVIEFETFSVVFPGSRHFAQLTESDAITNSESRQHSERECKKLGQLDGRHLEYGKLRYTDYVDLRQVDLSEEIELHRKLELVEKRR